MKINALSKTYEGRCVLNTPDIELKPGEICAVIGANGSGKSTFARIVAGVLPADGGRRAFDRRVDIGYMPQKSYAFRMSTLGNLRLSGDKARAQDMLKKLGIAHLEKNQAKRLSGGETSRMALGRVMMSKHELIILDEPTASMDMESTALTETLVRDYCRESGCAVLWVTHSLQQARRIAGSAIYMHKGALLEYGSAERILFSPEKEETARFLEFYGK